MNLDLADKRVAEAAVLKWCIDHPEEFSMVAHSLADYHIHYPPFKALWAVLRAVHAQHGVFPTMSECQSLVDTLKDYDPSTRAHLKGEVGFLYGVAVTEVTGEKVRGFVAQRELAEVSQVLAGAALDPATASEHVHKAMRRLEDLAMVLGRKQGGTVFNPFSLDGAKGIREQIQGLYGGGDPVPTGISRLDRRLKGGGMQAHLTLVVGPSGGGKTTMALHTAIHSVRNGKRVVYFALDDSPGELSERIYSHMLMEDISEVDWDTAYLDQCLENEVKSYPGAWYGEALDPNSVRPEDLAGHLKMLQYRFAREDAARGVPEELRGQIDLVVIDSGDQLGETAAARSKDTWHNARLTFERLNIIPSRFGCATMVTVQGNQQAVGASQITMRNVGESFGKVKPAKLVLGFAQTIQQRHEKAYIDFSAQIIRDNLGNLVNVDPEGDRNTPWKPWWLCIMKNTRAREVDGPASWVKLPMLVDYSTCRITEDFQRPEELILEDKQTKREEREADGDSRGPSSRGGKRGPKS